MKTEFISEFYSPSRDRKATITRDQYHWVVDLFEDSQKIETRLITDHTLQYAEDLAENFVKGYGEFNKDNK